MIDIVANPDSMWRKKNVYTSCVEYIAATLMIGTDVGFVKENIIHQLT